MFSKIKDALSKFNLGIGDKKATEALIKEIQRNLIRADVDISLVFELSKNIRKEAMKKPKTGITKKEHIINAVYEELTRILGKEKETVSFNKDIIVLAGLYGSGKTTASVKLANYISRKNLSVGIVCTDLDRPAAYEQLSQFASKTKAEVFGEKDAKRNKVIDVLNEGIDHFAKKDIIIVDTAGRSSFDDELKKELKSIIDASKAKANKNVVVYLVCSGDIGKAAKNLAGAFKDVSGGIDGVILTKMDSSAKGGGALSSCYGAEAPVVFIGVGEKINDFEEYDPVRFTSRLLGMGDLHGLLEKVQGAIDQEEMEAMMEGELNMETFYLQLKNIKKMGSLSKMMSMIPGFSSANIPKNVMDTSEDKLKMYEAVISSMTKKERLDPELIDRSRIERIAKGSGVRTSDVKELLKQFRMIKKMTKKMQSKSFMKGKLGTMMKSIGGF
ncbi:MAG: signal recognition particle protein [Candidatus Nanohalarchaeota archaeon]|nr:MAG: signal recognition particle protein [Candidatus Nanohaloarchaeota archaeon]